MSDHESTAVFEFYLDRATWARGRNAIVATALVTGIACAIGFSIDRNRFAFSYLVSFMFFLAIALGALFFVMMQHLTRSAWSVTMRRVAENVMMTLPVAAVLFIPIGLNLPYLYEWMRPEAVHHSTLLQQKAAYLNGGFFLLRACVYFAIWSTLAFLLYRSSVRQDDGGTSDPHRFAVRVSAPGTLALIVTGTLASFDWLMSLEPEWYSTIFGIYVLSGGALAFISAWILILLGFRRAGILRRSVSREHYHDLGKWLFALTIFWSYIAFSQYVLIWYANMPEETIWYKHRISGSWGYLAAVLLIGRFILPFLLLVARGAKRSLALLGTVAAWMLLMHFVDLYWLIMPVQAPANAAPHWIDAITFAAVGSVFAGAFWYRLRSRALAPVGDVRFEQALHFRNV